MKIDLHLHTSASDGRLSPEELISRAASLRMRVIAITDHDTIDGIAPALKAARSFPDLRVIPGVEIDTDIPHGEVHILGYFISYENVELRGTLESLRHSRRDRAQRMLAKLDVLGMHIEWQRVLEIAGSGSIGRPHVAQAMVERGYVPSIKMAFNKYIGREGPAYAERHKMTPAEAVKFILKFDGLPVLAHPGDVDLENMLPTLMAAGLIGLEAYYGGYNGETVDRLVTVAVKNNLVITGGSDFHGLEGNPETGIGEVEVPQLSIDQLFSLASKRNPVNPL